MAYTKFDTPKQLLGIAGNSSNAELVKSIPITKGAPYNIQLVYQERLLEVKAGDLIVAHADWECTTPYDYNLMVCTYLSATPTADYKSGEIELTEKNGRNINGNIHHEHVGRIGQLSVTKNYPELYINFCAYTASTAAITGHKLIVEQDYGRLVVRHYR